MTIDNLNFNRADFTAQAPEAACTWCTRGLDGSYFDVQGIRVCGVCAERAREASPQDTRATFLRSILFGSMTAALVGMAYFALLNIAHGSLIAFASIGVGYIIAKAMRMGSNGVGGRRYQVMAAVLTYIAVVIAFSASVLGSAGMPRWAYPFLVLAPILSLFVHHASFGALQILIAGIGMRWAWQLMSGAPWRITGPHPIDERAPSLTA